MFSFTRLVALRCAGFAAFLLAGQAQAQLSLTAPGTPETITFDATVPGVSNGAWAGLGFQPTPVDGQLDSDAWATWGWSNGILNFGGTQTTPNTDFRRGIANAPVTQGGIYSMGGVGITGRALGFQPGTGDFQPGDITLRVANNTGSALSGFSFSYDLHYRNDGARSASIHALYSIDGAEFVTLPGTMVITPGAATGTDWVPNHRSATIESEVIPDGAYIRIRWRVENLGGSGAADEIALDNITVEGSRGTLVHFATAATSVDETDGTVAINVGIVNPSPLDATTADLVLVSGDAERIAGYTTQTITFPAGSNTPEQVVLNIIDNGECDGDVDLVFELQNITGGLGSASATDPHQFTLSIADDNISPVTSGQAFDAAPGDQWIMGAGELQVRHFTGTQDTPLNQRITSGTHSWQVAGEAATLDLEALNIQDWQNVVITARLMSTSVVATNNGADISDSVAFYVSLDGAPFPVVPDLRVRGSLSGNARWGHTNGTGVAVATAGTPAQYQPAGSGLRNADGYSTIRIHLPTTANTVALRIHAVNNTYQECWSIDDIRITGTGCERIYYSRASGSETTPTWSTTRAGYPAPAVPTFSKNATAYVQDGHHFGTTDGASVAFKDLVVETGGSLALTGATTLEVHGNELAINGPFSGAGSTLRFPGNTAMAFNATHPVSVTAIHVEGAAVTQGVDHVTVSDRMEVPAGSYDVDNVGNNGKYLRFLSSATHTARLGIIFPPATFSGQIEMERYVPAGVTNWRLISSPTRNSRLSSLEDDFLTAGYPGSHVPNFQSPVGSGILWPSIRHYDETDPGADMLDGLIGVPADTMIMRPGKGFAAWAGTNLASTTAFTMDLRSAPHQAIPAIELPMSWTDNGIPWTDGWNLVGNPLPSPIDFSLVQLGADVEPYYYIFDPVSGNNAIWDESLGLSIPSGRLNGNIQSFQGFWLKANGPDVTTTVSEVAKVYDPNGGGLFGGDQQTDAPLFRLTVSSDATAFTDEAVVHFGVGSPQLGAHDIAKFAFSHPSAPRISTLTPNGEELILNAHGPDTDEITIPVAIHAPVAGNYAITLLEAATVLGTRCLVLEDLLTGTSTTLSEGTPFAFTSEASQADDAPRFLLHASAALTHTVEHASCNGAIDGAATINLPGVGPWDLQWRNAQGFVIRSDAGVSGSVTMTGLPAGTFTVAVDGPTGCGAINTTFTLTQPQALQATTTVSDASCAEAVNGTAQVLPSGGTAPYTVQWSNGSNGFEVITGPGELAATVSDANGCTLAMTNVLIGAGDGVSAAMLPSANTLTVGDTLLLFNLSPVGATSTWSFGDGSVSDEVEPFHVYTAAGTYTVTLSVSENGCTATTTAEITVQGGLSLPSVANSDTRVWSNGTDFIIERPTTTGQVQVDVLDATGRMIRGTQFAASQQRIAIPGTDLPAGVYFVRLSATKGEHRTFRVAHMR